MSTKLRDIYDSFLESDELYEVMPGAKGVWDDDKVEFKLIHEGLSSCLDTNTPLEVLNDFHHREMNLLFGEEEEDDDIFD